MVKKQMIKKFCKPFRADLCKELESFCQIALWLYNVIKPAFTLLHSKISIFITLCFHWRTKCENYIVFMTTRLWTIQITEKSTTRPSKLFFLHSIIELFHQDSSSIVQIYVCALYSCKFLMNRPCEVTWENCLKIYIILQILVQAVAYMISRTQIQVFLGGGGSGRCRYLHTISSCESFMFYFLLCFEPHELF